MWLPCHCSAFLQVSCVDLVPVAPGCLWTICSALDLVKLALAYYSSGVSWSVRTATAVVSFRTTTALLSMHLSMAVFIFSADTSNIHWSAGFRTYIPAGAAVIGVSLFVLILDIGHPSELRAFVFYAEVRMCVQYVHVHKLSCHANFGCMYASVVTSKYLFPFLYRFPYTTTCACDVVL